MYLELYRSIAVERDQASIVVSKIRNYGLKGDEGFWKFIGWRLRKHIDKLFHK